MKRFLAILTVGLMLTGCGWLGQGVSHLKSGLVKINREITLYADNGTIIRQWKGRYNVEVDGASARFIDDGNVIVISGTFVVEEVDK